MVLQQEALARRSRPRSRRTVVIAIVTVALLGGGVANAVVSPPATGLVYSADASHNSPKRIAHATVSSNVDLFIGGAASRIAKVDYYVDDAVGAGNPAKSSTTAPFDFSLDRSTLSVGVHTILAAMTTTTGAQTDLFARFAVADAATPTTTSTTPPTTRQLATTTTTTSSKTDPVLSSGRLYGPNSFLNVPIAQARRSIRILRR